MCINNIRTSFKHTLAASYIGYIAQAIVNNFTPLLFLTFQSTYGISLEKITLLVTINFAIQLCTDALSTKLIDLFGYRRSVVIAHISCAAGLVGLGVFPDIMPNPYSGLLLAVLLYAFGGGFIEVLVSPIVEACPTENKSAAMSLLHSFYCWGHVFVVLASTLFFTLAGIGNWRILAFLWAIIPLVNSIYFAIVPIRTLSDDGPVIPIKKVFSMKLFWVFVVLMISSGASEQAMSQWASAFAEAGLGISKTAGDLAGPCMFAILMGCSRLFYAKFSEKIELSKFMILSGGMCIAGYLLASFASIPVLSLVGCGLCGLSVGIMWPGTYSIASSLCKGGTAMFALLALAGDFGCMTGPTVVGIMADKFGGSIKKGIVFAIIFPTLMIIGLIVCRKMAKKTSNGSKMP